MSTLFGLDIKSPPRYRTDDQTMLNHYNSVWQCWLQLRRELKVDYDDSTITWNAVMKDTILTPDPASTEKTDACNVLRFICKVHEKRPERAVAIIQDLHQRASSNFKLDRFYLQCGDHKFSELQHIVEVYRIVQKHICDPSREQERVVANDDEKCERRRMIQEMDRMILILFVVVAALILKLNGHCVF